MSRRILAVLLLLVAFAALVAQRMFPFLADAPWALRTAVTVVGVVCLLVAVSLWLRGLAGRGRER
ncbi:MULTISPECIES: hypothetical protein [Polymorphospora]|uniref:Uncharacterized protein n=1 Tax=Polymorphospora lycopeni TaxID=3140240 RepID=A0ABV5D0X4_9ACTN